MLFTNVFLHGGRAGESTARVYALDSYLGSAERTHSFSFHVFHSNVQPDLMVPWLLDTVTWIGTGMDLGLPLPTNVFGSQILQSYHGEYLHGLEVVTGLVGGKEDLLQVSLLQAMWGGCLAFLGSWLLHIALLNQFDFDHSGCSR